MEVKKEKLFAGVCIYFYVSVCWKGKKSFQGWGFGQSWRLSQMISLRRHARTHTCTRTHTRQDYCLLPKLSPHLLNTYQWGFAVVGAGHNYNKWFFFRRQNNGREGGGAVNMSGRPSGECANVLSWKWKGWLTGWPHAAVMRLQTIAPLPPSIFLSLTVMIAQTNQSTCVLTPKSQSLTCPRVFTSILDGLTSVETNCLIELQHKHCAAIICQPQLGARAPLYSPRWSIFRLHRYVRPLTTWRCR